MKIDLSVNKRPRESGVFCWAFGFAQAPSFDFAQAPSFGFAQAPSFGFAQAPSFDFALATALGFARQRPSVTLGRCARVTSLNLKF